MVSAPCPRGLPAPIPDSWAGEDGGRPGGCSSRVQDRGPRPHAPLQLARLDPCPQADPAGRRAGCDARGGMTRGWFPRRGSPGILFARLKGSPPWLPFLQPGGDYCPASSGRAADGRVGGESDSAGGRAGAAQGSTRTTDAFLGAGDANWRGPVHPHVGLAAARADTWPNATPRAQRSALSKPRAPPCCGSWGERGQGGLEFTAGHG
ncbi:hypothetical protein NN561_015912 [Cricetulus griseus]